MTSKQKEEGCSRNTPNLRINCKKFANKEGVKKSQNAVDVTYGSPQAGNRGCVVDGYAFIRKWNESGDDDLAGSRAADRETDSCE